MDLSFLKGVSVFIRSVSKELSQPYIATRNFTTSVQCFVKRKYPINEEESKLLPVFQYPVSSRSIRRVYVWGLAEHGALGNALECTKSKRTPLKSVRHPNRLHFAEKHKIVDIACGYGFTAFAVDAKDGYKVFGCGINTDSQIGYHAPRRDHPLGLVLAPAPVELPVHSRVKKVAAGRAHLIVLSEREGAFTLGNNAYGQCGRRIIEDEKYSGSQTVHCIPSLDGAVIEKVFCGQDHSIFVTKNGDLYACGWGADGQTGLGTYDTVYTPTKLKGDVEGENIIKVSCAADCVLALNAKGEVFGWGNNEYGQLLLPTDLQQLNAPRHIKLAGVGKVLDIASGGSFCLVVNDAGDVFVWGYGILGVGPSVDHAKKPVLIPTTLFGRNEFSTESRIVSVAAGMSHMAAVTNYGDLYMWGRNRGGCLGLGHENNQFFPLRVAVGAQVKKVSCGVDHTVALCQPYV
ncbi:RCC1-like G exchanging factor-like protein [Schistocerca americana]|uniref:RCC1-like G exchanging factor-like protein n=1 Tax=Schistocerca americana TaxID=7009 RepID=UPI001F501E05|nr:RCC1-like G exchanging factor-like protein [Schistocerca americana]XP_047001027.1 RCC1-like G exchanging factor-like protein [Schistocerca americana]XP_047001035.1 RCC1-like G exchanging factor-like protein [Schistocerca americana]XP_047001041.1 RCC1-like G exchanging factor-like protein [Schistocerca americana]